MEFASFLTSLATSFSIFVVLMLLFTWLSRKKGNTVVYYPSRILKGMDPWEGSSRTRNPFAWIREAVSSTEEDVIKMAGLDAAVYFVFLSSVLGILVLSGVVLLPVLLPVAFTDDAGRPSSHDTVSNGTFNQLDKLSMANINEKSPRLWAFLGATYWVSLVTYSVLWKAYKHVSKLRAQNLMSSDFKPEQFAVLVRDLPDYPKGQTRKEQVDSYFKSIYPDSFYRSLVVTNNKQVNKIYEELEEYKKKLSCAEAIYMESKKMGNPEGKKPTNKTGFMGIFGKKVDSIDYYKETINELTVKLETEQKTTLQNKQQCSALVFFNNRLTASSASQTLHAQMVNTWTVVNAPEPRQLIWTNLEIKFFSRKIRQYLVYIIVFLTIVFYMIPIGFISALTTLENLQKLIPFIKPVVKVEVIKTVLEAYLPQIALIVFLALLPKFLLFLSKAEGIPGESHAVRGTSGKYFYFSVLNVFIGVAIGNTLFERIKEIEKNPNSIMKLLAESLPKNATFFLTYVALQFFVGYGLELSRLVPLTLYHLKKRYITKTEADLKEAWAPGSLGYETRVPGDLLIITIVYSYSVIAPVIIPFGVLYFGFGWLVLRNQALKVFVPSYESYGRMWPHIHTRLVAAMLLFQVTMIGYFTSKLFVYTSLLVPLPIVTLVFAYVCSNKFYGGFKHNALEVVARHEVKETVDMEQVFRAYVPKSLKSDKVENGTGLMV